MHVIPFLLKKDFLRLKFLLIVWFLLVLIQSALSVSGINFAVDIFKLQMFLPMLTQLINFLQGLMSIVIIPLIIQEDSLVGTSAFWFTRPIPRKGLLVTKSCFILTLLVVLPCIAEIVVLLVNGITANYILFAIPEILMEKLSFIMPFVILASITPKLSRFALIGTIIFVVYIVGYSLLFLFSIFFEHLERYIYNYNIYQNPTLELSISVVKSLFLIVCGSLLVVHQYLTRYTARTIRWLIAAFMVMMCITRVWHFDFLKDVPATESRVAISDSLDVDFDRRYMIVSDELISGKEASRKKTISTKQLTAGLFLGQFAILRNLKNVQMQYPDGLILKSEHISKEKKEAYINKKFMQPIQNILKNTKLLNPFNENFSYTEIFSLDESYFNRYKNKEGTYSAQANFDIYKYKISSAIPLRRGEKGKFGSEQIVIYDVLERPKGISVIIGEKKMNLLFDRKIKKKSRYDFYLNMHSDFEIVYLLRNKKHNEVFLAEIEEDIDTAMPFQRFRLENKAKQIIFTYVNERSGPLPKINRQWLEDAELVRIDAIKVGSQHKNFIIKPFSLPAKSTEPAGPML